VLISGEPFERSMLFVSKAGAYTSDLSGAPLLGRFQALPTNIRLGWKSLPGTNTRLLQALVNYACKKFYDIWPGSPMC